MARSVKAYYQNMKERYGDEYTSKFKDIWTVFVIEKGERNNCDQKQIEIGLYETQGIRTMRLNLTEIAERGVMCQKTSILKIQEREVGFVYFRTGYDILQYENE